MSREAWRPIHAPAVRGARLWQWLPDAVRREPWLWSIAGLVALTHLLAAGQYDFNRDELYFIICGWHPDFGYVDEPPLVPLVAAATQLFGENLWLLRLPVVIAATAQVFVTAALARLLGGDGKAVMIAAAASAMPPLILEMSATLFTSAFDALSWTVLAYLLARAALRADGRALIWAGLVAGIAIETKYTILPWLLGLALGLAVTPERRLFGQRKLWYGIALAAAIALPNLLWQALHGWPFLELARDHAAFDRTGPVGAFLLHRLLDIGPVLAILAFAGIITAFLRPELKPARFIVIAFLFVVAVLIIVNGRVYYLVGGLPALFAIGAVAAARLKPWLLKTGVAIALVVFLVQAPFFFPVLPRDLLVRYWAALHGIPAPDPPLSTTATMRITSLADEFGWHEMVRAVAEVYRKLAPEANGDLAILAWNLGEAAAVDFYGPAEGLPPAISGHNQYFLWGPHGATGNVLIVINGDPRSWREVCGDVAIAAVFDAAAPAGDNGRPIMICRGFRLGNVSEQWSRFKYFQ
jgi:4-amino-4-deoxy-L-arabinose transferase-like glycosyltransferase